MAIDDKYITSKISAELKKQINETSRGGSRRARAAFNATSPNPSNTIPPSENSRKNEAEEVERKHTSIVHQTGIKQVSEHQSIEHQTTIKPASEHTSKEPKTDINQASSINQSSIKQASSVNQTNIELASNGNQTDINHKSNEHQTSISRASVQNAMDNTNDKLRTNTDHISNVYQSHISRPSERTSKITSNTNQSYSNRASNVHLNTDQNIQQNMYQKSEDISVQNIAYEATTLLGHQLSVFSFLLNQCQINGAFFTKRLSIDFLKLNVELSKPAIRLAIQRLKEKKLILSRESKEGRGGWTVYEIPHLIFKEISKLDFIFPQTPSHNHTSKHTSELTSQPASLGSSSSSSLNNTITTKDYEMPSDWKSIAIPGFLVERGFRETHVKQIYQSQKNNISAEQVQESLHEYAYDLENGHVKPYKGAVNMFLGVVRGQGNVWASEALANAEALAILKLKKARETKIENERNKEFLETKRKVDEILSKLNDEEKRKIHNPTNDSEFGTYMYELALKEKIKEQLNSENLYTI